VIYITVSISERLSGKRGVLATVATEHSGPALGTRSSDSGVDGLGNWTGSAIVVAVRALEVPPSESAARGTFRPASVDVSQALSGGKRPSLTVSQVR
jgi:hypothetical protein